MQGGTDMFVTSMPGRIIGAKNIEIASNSSVFAGGDGVFCRVCVESGDIVITEASASDRTAGYKAASGEIIEFSGKAVFYNSSESTGAISVILMDTI